MKGTEVENWNWQAYERKNGLLPSQEELEKLGKENVNFDLSRELDLVED
jgi:hypothetical protein